MLGVGLRKLCPQDSFGYAFREKKTVRQSTGSKMACEGPLDGFSVPLGPNLAAKAARKPSLGGSGGALGTLLALLELFWGLLGRSWGVPAAPGRLLGIVLGLPGS